MGRYCCVVGCKNTDRSRSGIHNRFKFYSLRSLPPERKQLWLNAINRKNEDGSPWGPSAYSSICNWHFINGCASNDSNNPAYVPTIFPVPGLNWQQQQHKWKPKPVARNPSTCSSDTSYPADSSPVNLTDYTKDFKGFVYKKYNSTVTACSDFWDYVSDQYPELVPKPLRTLKMPPESQVPSPSESVSSPSGVVGGNEALIENKLTNPLFKIPMLEYGWKREIVCRTSSSSGLRTRQYDVYYYTPEGKKLRSCNQISDYLSAESELTSNHFTFSKGVVGLSVDMEWVREARGVSTTKLSKDSSQGVPIKSVRKTNVLNPKKRRRSKASSVYEDDSNRKRSKTSLYEDGDDDPDNDLAMGMLPPDWSPTIPATSQQAAGGPLVCSILCPKALGCIPTLQCISCLCLYHPQCLDLDPDKQYKSYVCINCRKKNEDELEAKKKQTIAPKVQKAPLTIQKIVPQSKNPVLSFTSKVITSRMNYKPKKVPLSLAPKPLRPLAPVPTHNNITNVLHNSSSAKDEPMQSIIQMGNKKFIAVAKRASSSIVNSAPPPSIITSPTLGVKILNENQLPTTARSPVGGAFVISKPTKVPGLLFPVPTSTQYYVLNNGKMVQPIISKVNNMESAQSKRSSLSSSDQTISKKSPILQSTDNLLSMGSNGLNILIQVFSYLPLDDLLRAAQVSRLFYAASRHFSLWKTIQLKNIYVQDWEKLARCLDKNDTEVLYFNQMKVKTDSDDVKNMWRSINQSLGKISSLQNLDLGKCAGPEINIIKQCPSLTYFSCSFNKKSLLDFYGLSLLQNLKHLYIRGVELNKMIGLKVLNIHVISKLKNLTHLALTSVKQSSQDTNWAMFLADMKQLEWLELGECTNFTHEFVNNALSHLVSLKRLRLEMVTELIANDILNTIATMPHLDTLELINFDVKPGFEESFSRCICLRHVLIIPTYIKQSAVTVQRMVIALSSMNHILTRVVWGLTMELLKVTEMLVTQHDFPLDPDVDCTDCIPIMPRVRLAMDDSPESKKAAQVQVIPVNQLKKILTIELPNVEVKLIKIPYVSTLKQFL
ncbi:hypothetical protein M8J75_016243 [Diaphorina citri]|nr:hypothetical protein M8J75_016243 [Diaphorina citri]KAI5734710.1 hypothetical protein M8J77_009739 [Diaphorina citri]